MSIKMKINIFLIMLPAMGCIYAVFTKQYSMALNSLLTIACLIAVMIINKKIPVLTTGTYYALLIFILLSVFAGRGLEIYRIIPPWDKALHFMSGFIFVFIGKNIYVKLNGNTHNTSLMNLFTLSFAVAIAGMWEIYEFTIDNLFNMVSQNGSLNDTMWDIIAGSTSAVIAIVFAQLKIRKQI